MLIVSFLMSIFIIYHFLHRSLPFRGSRSNLNEEERPINWANSPMSYIDRTTNWNEFPNGRWGDPTCPAFGDLSDSHYYRPAFGSKKDRLAIWGEWPITQREVYEVF